MSKDISEKTQTAKENAQAAKEKAVVAADAAMDKAGELAGKAKDSAVTEAKKRPLLVVAAVGAVVALVVRRLMRGNRSPK
ncbi:hypothetical protein [Nonomuraea longicatena]|uniref:DUF3618 domain-containing protein n=1 Tax=Nonomuraea longicatena TaxID=83682 RepID=A0ABP3Z649_9ACTN